MRILILGAGGHGKEIADILTASGNGSLEIGFIDDRWAEIGPELNGFPLLGTLSDLSKFDSGTTKVISAVGSPKIQRRFVELAENHGLEFTNAIHPSATISPSAKIGIGVSVFENASVHCNAKLGNHSCLNVGASISHDSVLGPFSILNPGARVAGGVEIGSDCYIGMEACVIQGVRIESQVTVGAGAVVIRNILGGSKVVGVPAREL